MCNIEPLTNKEIIGMEGKEVYLVWSDGSFTLKKEHEVKEAWDKVKEKLDKLEHPFHFEYKYVPNFSKDILIEWSERNKELLKKENLKEME